MEAEETDEDTVNISKERQAHEYRVLEASLKLNYELQTFLHKYPKG